MTTQSSYNFRVSPIINLAAGIQKTPLSQGEVIAAGRTAEPVVDTLPAKIVKAS